MKILHIANTGIFSGAENVICQIIGMFKGRHDVDFVYVSPDGPIRDALAERGVTYAPLSRMSVGELKRVIREQKPDVIHAHDMKASVVAALACGKIKLISHIHNNNFDSRILSIKSVGYCIAAKKASRIIWVSQSSFDGYFFHNAFREKSKVLYNIIDIPALYQKMQKDSKSYEYDVCFVGRLTQVKNPIRMLDIFKKLVGVNPKYRFAVVGTGEMADELKCRAEYLGIEKNVDFLGFQSNPTKIIHDSKVMIMTSYTEGTPMCALESMALGTPMVTTPVGGLPILIKDGVTGFMSNNDDELVEKINLIVTDEQLRKSMSDACVADAGERNNVDLYVEKLWEEYRGLRQFNC